MRPTSLPVAPDGLLGERALVTGAASGIGAACAHALAAAGAEVVLADVADATPVAEAIVSGGRQAGAHPVDVTDASSVTTLVAETGPFGIVVNSAGILTESALEDTDLAQFDRTIDVNLRGTFLVGQATLPAMRTNRRGRFIAITSELALTGRARYSAYVASKAAVIGLVRCWALEFAPHVLVNALGPGPTDTPMLDYEALPDAMREAETPLLGRIARPEEIAAVAVFLAGPGATFITGQTISPNGGAVFV